MQCPAIGDDGDEEVAAMDDELMRRSNYVEKEWMKKPGGTPYDPQALSILRQNR